MKVLAISDLHGKRFEFPRIKPDLILFLGDIPWQEVERIDKMYSCPKIGVLGNHDRPDTFEGTSVINAHGKIVEIGGLKIAGFGGCPRYNEREFGQFNEKTVERFVEGLEKVDLFIAHSNPSLVAHKRYDRAHAGFRSFDEYIRRKKPKYFLHGHLHIQQQQLIGATRVISIYPYLEFDVREESK